jgi:mediator of RNA polymerase II transcription subunit 7
MTDQQPSNALAAAFPSPPPFYQHFTPDNLDRIAALRAAQQPETANASSDTQTTIGETSAPSPALRLLDLPPELRFLQPPEPPTEGVYRSFGDVFNVRSPSNPSSLKSFDAMLTLLLKSSTKASPP